jgi:excisionase family DNA binding protein
MIAAEDVQLVQETVETLRARGENERARAVAMVLDVALSIQPAANAPERAYLTTGQAASLLGVSRQTIVNWVTAGKLPGARLGGRTMVLRAAVKERYEVLVVSSLPNPKHPPEVVEAQRRLHERMVASLPTELVARLQELHEKMEDGST